MGLQREREACGAPPQLYNCYQNGIYLLLRLLPAERCRPRTWFYRARAAPARRRSVHRWNAPVNGANPETPGRDTPGGGCGL